MRHREFSRLPRRGAGPAFTALPARDEREACPKKVSIHPVVSMNREGWRSRLGGGGKGDAWRETGVGLGDVARRIDDFDEPVRGRSLLGRRRPD